MSWVTRKLDMLVAAVCATAAGMTASQLQAFIHQYLQRLGGHVDEARVSLQTVLETANPIGGPTPEALAPVAARIQERIDVLVNGYQAIQSADTWTRPFAFFRHADPAIAQAAFNQFEPALPLSPDSLVFTLAGIVLALVAWEIFKFPFSLALSGVDKSRKKRRIFDSRSEPLT
ncbi:DUF2937 family protein [Rhodospirillum sp. A1_3_36]|uniref:DUF2937 family protein n=1 Tax=Rhodospirillum sp. A1_3_36 TaxID=3391666 RepID=UPI0039A48BD1